MRVGLFARRFVVSGVLVAAILLGGLLTLLHTPWFKRTARDFIVRQAAAALDGELSIGRLDGDILTGLVLSDVALRQGEGTPVRAARITLHYSVWQLARSHAIVIDRLELSGLVLSVERLPSGGLNLASLVKRRPSGGPRRPIDIRRIQLEDAALTFDGPWGPSWMHLPLRITQLTTTLGLRSSDGSLTLPIAALRAEAEDPRLSIRSFTGTVSIERDGWGVSGGVLRTGQSALDVSASFKRSGYEVAATAAAFDFPEMAGLVPGLKSIDVTASLQVTMRGPQNGLDTHVTARSPGGDITADLVLDSTVPGWKGRGRASLTAFDIAQWLPTEVASKLTGQADYDLLLGLGRHFPRGRFAFTGPSVVYAGYEARDFRTTGTLVVDRVLVESASGLAYGSPFRASGWIDIPEPYGFHLTGHAARLDLRLVPATVPVPRMRSSLTFEYDAAGRFHDPVISGTATFDASTFLDVRIAAGGRGTIDTSGPRVTYSADATIAGLDVGQIGEAFELGTLREPRYNGVVAGDFALAGAGLTPDDLTIDLKGQHVDAALFGGRFLDTELDLHVRNDSLAGSGAGRFERIDPSVPLVDSRIAGQLDGRFSLAGSMPGFFTTGFAVDVSVLEGSISLAASRVAGMDVDQGSIEGRLDTGLATITQAGIQTPAGHVSGAGRIGVSRGDSDFSFEAQVADASRLNAPIPIRGTGTFKGRVTGPLERTRVSGSFTASNLDAGGVTALSASGTYRVEGAVSDPADAAVSVDGSASFLAAFGRQLGTATATVNYRQQRLQGEAEARLPDGRLARVTGGLVIHADHNELHVTALQVALGPQRWRLSPDAGSPLVAWSGAAISVRDLVFAAGGGAGRIAIAGELGRTVPHGEMSVEARAVALEELPPLLPVVAGYRGRLDGTITIGGTLAEPGVSARFAIVDGGVRNFAFQSLTGSGRWTPDAISGELRLDQRPGVWLTALGSVPTELLTNRRSTKPVNLAVHSSTIDLGLIEGVTTSVRGATGTLQLDITVKGQVGAPEIDGFLDVTGAAFDVPATGVRYRNGSAHVAFVPQAVRVDFFRLEDSNGDPLELSGTAATEGLRLGGLGFELSANRFDVLRNQFGDLALNGVIRVNGTILAPVVAGDLAIDRATLDVDALLPLIRRPYAVTADQAGRAGGAAPAPIPAVSALWNALTLRLRLLAPNNLAVRGENMRLTRDAVASLGDVNVVFDGDLAIRKEPQGRLKISGALQTVRGAYAYQGRRFTIERDGTLRFVGEDTLDPLLSITATRTVSGVLIRAKLNGQASAPELELTSTPALDQSDILSLLLFNQPVNELALAQRNELALQAATLASGFVVSPAISAVGEKLGLDFLELEPTGALGTTSFRLSAGREVWKGLFVSYAREFSSQQYNEVQADYELTRYLRIRANASDVSGIRSRASLFRRVERAGIDLIFFFSY